MGQTRLAGTQSLAKQALEFFHNKIGHIWDHLSPYSKHSELP